MTPQQIVGMAGRLFALWLLAVAFQMFTISMAMTDQFQEPAAKLLYLIPLVPLGLAVLLWLFPMTIAHKILPRTRETNVLRMPVRDATAAASAILGLYVLIAALPHVAATAGVMVFGGGGHFMAAWFTPERTLETVGVALQCLLGVFLLFRPWWVAEKVFPATVARAANDE